jgi:PKD domain
MNDGSDTDLEKNSFHCGQPNQIKVALSPDAYMLRNTRNSSSYGGGAMRSKGPFVVALLLLAAFSFMQFYHVAPAGPRLISAQPFGPGIHRTYRLVGQSLSPGSGWNGSAPGPLITANDGDNVTILLKSADGVTHSWYIDLNKDGVLDDGEAVTRSLDFSSPTIPLNFTFTVKLGSVIPHGGTYTYYCQQHPGLMFGTFKFNAGPVASFTHSPPTPLAGNPVSFDGSASWPTTGHAITNYSWNFGDLNTTSSGSIPTITHTYATNKTYTITLNVTDNFSPPQTAQATGSVTVLPRPPVPFDYQITTSANATIVAGQSTTIQVRLNLVKGTTENVTLKTILSPSDPSVQVSTLNVTSGFPTFSTQFTITTPVSTASKMYTVTIVAQSSTGVDHNATYTLVTTPTPSSPNYILYASLGGVGAVAALGVLFFVRRSRKASAKTKASPSS